MVGLEQSQSRQKRFALIRTMQLISLLKRSSIIAEHMVEVYLAEIIFLV